MLKQNKGISIKTKQKRKLFLPVPNRHVIFFLSNHMEGTDIFPLTLWVFNCIGLFPGSLRILMSTMVVAVLPIA